MAPEPMPPNDDKDDEADYVLDTRGENAKRGAADDTSRAEAKTREMIVALHEERAMVGTTDPARTANIDAEIARLEAELDT